MESLERSATYALRRLLAVACLNAHYIIGQDQGNRGIGSRPNQGREPPLVWSIEFMKKVHVASNDTAPLMFRCADTWLRASA